MKRALSSLFGGGRNVLRYQRGDSRGTLLRKTLTWIALVAITGSGAVEIGGLLSSEAQAAAGNYTLPHDHSALYAGGDLGAVTVDGDLTIDNGGIARIRSPGDIRLQIDTDASGSHSFSITGELTNTVFTANESGIVGGPAFNLKMKTADETVTSSTTLQVDDHLQGWVLPTGYYKAEFLLHYGGSSGDLKIGFQRTGGGLGRALFVCNAYDNSGAVQVTEADSAPFFSGSGFTVTASGSLLGTIDALHCTGFLEATGDISDLDFVWAQNSSSAVDTEIGRGSWMEFRRIN